jgi:succinylarginine dihydrolase
MVIAEKPSKKKEPKLAAERKTAERQVSAGSSENPISTIKNFVCKYSVLNGSGLECHRRRIFQLT